MDTLVTCTRSKHQSGVCAASWQVERLPCQAPAIMHERCALMPAPARALDRHELCSKLKSEQFARCKLAGGAVHFNEPQPSCRSDAPSRLQHSHNS